MSRYIILVICVFATSCANVLLKSSANTLKSLPSTWALAFEPVFILALFLYGSTVLAFMWCLKEVPLNKAYLFMSLAYVFVPLLSWIFFGETISIRYVISVLLILGGILVAILQLPA